MAPIAMESACYIRPSYTNSIFIDRCEREKKNKPLKP